MQQLRIPTFVFVLLATLALGVAILCTSCTTITSTEPTSPTCASVVANILAETQAAGFKYLGAQGSPTGDQAIFSNGQTARLYIIANSRGIADYLVEEAGWTHVSECDFQDKTKVVVTKTVELAPTGDEALRKQKQGGGLARE